MSLSVLLNIYADWCIFPYAFDSTLFPQINQLFCNKKEYFCISGQNLCDGFVHIIENYVTTPRFLSFYSVSFYNLL